MKITSIQEKTVSIASAIRNAYIDFSKMTVSVLALETDVVRDGRRVVGYGFNSNGRYAQGGLLRERFIPRLAEAAPAALLDASGDNLDPFKIWDTVMRNEKPGGHGERSVAVGVIDMAVWDAVAKIAGRPLYRLLAERCGRTPADDVFVYAAGGYYYPGKDMDALRREMDGYLELGYRVVKMKIGAAPLADDLARIEAVLELLRARTGTRRPVGAWPWTRTAASTCRRRWPTPRRSRRSTSSGTRSRATRSTTGCRPRSPAATRGRWRRARTSSRTRTRPTCCATAGCGLRSTGCRWTRRSPTGWWSTCARSRRSRRTAGRPGAASRTAGTSLRCTSRPGSGLAATSPTRASSSPSAALRTRPPCAQGRVRPSECPGIGFEEKAALIELFRKIF